MIRVFSIFVILLINYIDGGNGAECAALVEFKAEVTDDYGRLSDWGYSSNCCEWKGVGCDNRMKHVVALDLNHQYLRGKISPSLLKLHHLQYLDLSFNIYNRTTIPYFIGSFAKLHHLSLSGCNFVGPIPYHLGNLSTVKFLDLSYNAFHGINLDWLSGFRSLEYLDLSGALLGATIPYFIGSLSKLQHLNLGYCGFEGSIPHHLANLSMLQFLDLSYNYFSESINLDWLSGCQSLEYLDLSGVGVETTNMQAIHRLTKLKEIHLSQCGLMVVDPHLLSLNYSNSLSLLDLSLNVLDSAALNMFLNMSSAFTYIDFSSNYIEGNIPADSLGNLLSLSHLDLRGNNFGSSIPNVLGNLTKLSYLDLSYNQLHGEYPRPSKNYSLTYLDMSWNNLDGHLPRLLTWLTGSTRLSYLALNHNRFTGSFPNMSTFSNLRKLYLQENRLNGELVQDFLQLPNLESLDLSINKFTGISPAGNNVRLPNLESLDLSSNKFKGRQLNLSSCGSLRVLKLFGNSFNGSLQESIGHLSRIEQLHAAYNNFEGVITEAHLSSLPRLRELDLSFNLNITMRINGSWIHPVQFHVLSLAYCKLGPDFPKWLQKQNQLKDLDISNSGIIDVIPAWFWGNIGLCRHLNMSHNHIYGSLPDLPSKFQLLILDLSYNDLTGLLPNFSVVFTLNLSRNKFFGPIHNFCKDLVLVFLDLSNNLLSGEIPQKCFISLLSLDYINLSNNNFSGEIASTNHMGCQVSSLHLRNNSFRGEIPRSLLKCSALKILDLGENELSGKIPVWLGASMPNLVVLILKSNTINGSLPSSICHLANIQVVDISLNKITGTIPHCISNFTQMSLQVEAADSWKDMFYLPRNGTDTDNFHDSASIIWKGTEETYINTLGLLKVIDLSSNELTGVIPHEITSLFGLLGLNLSRNNLMGLIPRDIDRLKLLNFLDLSRNNLSGDIPDSVSKLSHLGVLDLSYNNLSGRIPWDTHMQTFGASAYLGNPELCGPPLLSRPCPGEDEKPSNEKEDEEEEEDEFITRGFYVSMLLGFIVAFWVVFWILFFNRWWYVSTMRIYTVVADWFYVRILVNKRRLHESAHRRT